MIFCPDGLFRKHCNGPRCKALGRVATFWITFNNFQLPEILVGGFLDSLLIPSWFQESSKQNFWETNGPHSALVKSSTLFREYGVISDPSLLFGPAASASDCNSHISRITFHFPNVSELHTASSSGCGAPGSLPASPALTWPCCPLATALHVPPNGQQLKNIHTHTHSLKGASDSTITSIIYFQLCTVYASIAHTHTLTHI